MPIRWTEAGRMAAGPHTNAGAAHSALGAPHTPTVGALTASIYLDDYFLEPSCRFNGVDYFYAQSLQDSYIFA